MPTCVQHKHASSPREKDRLKREREEENAAIITFDSSPPFYPTYFFLEILLSAKKLGLGGVGRKGLGWGEKNSLPSVFEVSLIIFRHLSLLPAELQHKLFSFSVFRGKSRYRSLTQKDVLLFSGKS